MIFWLTAAGASPVRTFILTEHPQLGAQFGGQVREKQREFQARGFFSWDRVSFEEATGRQFDGAVRIALDRREVRVFFAMDDRVPALVMLHACWKKGEKWPQSEVRLAEKRWREYRAHPQEHGRR